MSSRAVSFVVLLTVCGCDKPAPPVTPADAGPPTSGIAPTAPSVPPEVATDLDVTALQKLLKCGGVQHKDACRALDEFAKAERWQLRIPSGEGRWAGNAYQIEKGLDRTEVILLSARQVPTSQLGPGDLPLRVGTGPMPDDRRTAGLKLAAALSRGDTVPRTNDALIFAKTWVSGRECSVVPTRGASVRLVCDHDTYIREAPAQKIIVVEPHQGAAAAPGDGMIAEVWPVSW